MRAAGAVAVVASLAGLAAATPARAADPPDVAVVAMRGEREDPDGSLDSLAGGALAPDGGVYAVSQITHPFQPGDLAFRIGLTRFSADGQVVWHREHFPGELNAYPVDVVADATGAAFVLSTARLFIDDRVSVVAFEPDDGAVRWEYTGTSTSEIPRGIALSDAGDVLVVVRGDLALQTMCLAADDGRVLWRHDYGRDRDITYVTHAGASACIPDGEGGAFAVGSIVPAAGGDPAALLWRVSSGGGLAWAREMAPGWFTHIVRTASGDLVVAGPEASGSDWRMARFEADGDLVWESRRVDQRVRALAVRADGSVLAASLGAAPWEIVDRQGGRQQGDADIVVAAYDVAGEQLWETHRFMAADTATPERMALAADGGATVLARAADRTSVVWRLAPDGATRWVHEEAQAWFHVDNLSGQGVFVGALPGDRAVVLTQSLRTVGTGAAEQDRSVVLTRTFEAAGTPAAGSARLPRGRALRFPKARIRRVPIPGVPGESEDFRTRSELRLRIRNRSRDSALCVSVAQRTGAFRAGGEYVVPPRSAVRLTLYFRPPAAGDYEDQLAVTTSDPAAPLVTYRLVGRATGPKP